MSAPGTATILRADARALPLPDASVDLIVTSPPYWSLRSYTDGGEHYDGQIGAEPTPAEYVANLVDCTREWMRALKPTGSVWVNLGDKYNGSGGTAGHSGANGAGQRAARRSNQQAMAIPVKSLLGLPWRYALRCMDDLGLILRAEVLWSKPNGLPESVTDRVRRSHEQWFHFTKSPRYFAAVDEIRTPASGYQRPGTAARATSPGVKPRAMADTCNPLGALPGSVWEIPTEPLTVPDHLGVDHFAAFPTEWPRRIILGWSPSGWCTACGEPRLPITEGGGYDPEALARRGTASQEHSHRTASGRPSPLLSVNLSGREKERYRIPHRITGHACACPGTSAPTRPAVVVDPFGGTGTTALVAKVLGRNGISVDMSADYCRLATWRTTDPGQLAKAMRLPKPKPQADGQGDLFADLNDDAA